MVFSLDPFRKNDLVIVCIYLYPPIALQIYDAARQSIGMQDIMTAILQTKGPVATLMAVKSAKMSIRSMGVKDFIEASTALENLNFGRVVGVGQGHRGKQYVFLKRAPQEAAEALGANPELCSQDVYAARYAKSSSKAIGFQLRAKLVAMKLVSQDHFM